MGIYIIKQKQYTEAELANLYFAKHPKRDAAVTSTIEKWAQSFFKSDIKKVATVQPIS